MQSTFRTENSDFLHPPDKCRSLKHPAFRGHLNFYLRAVGKQIVFEGGRYFEKDR
jgi:hypothetical protein